MGLALAGNEGLRQALFFCCLAEASWPCSHEGSSLLAYWGISDRLLSTYATRRLRKMLSTWSAMKQTITMRQRSRKKTTQSDSRELIALFLAELRYPICPCWRLHHRSNLATLNVPA
jgi:hypothetical protein